MEEETETEPKEPTEIMRKLIALAMGFALLAFASSPAAQTVSGNMAGTVVDKSASAVPARASPW